MIYAIWVEGMSGKIDSCEAIGTREVTGKNYPSIHIEILGYRIGQHIIFYRPIKDDKIG